MVRPFRATSVVAGFAIAGIVYGCTEQPVGPSKQPSAASLSITPSGARGLGHGFANRGIEEEIVKLEGAIPGIGGMYVDKGDVVVFAPREMTRGAVVSALARNAASMAITPEIRSQLVRGQRIRVVPGKFALSQLIGWQEALMAPLAKIDGFAGIDADESRNLVRINVSDANSEAAVKSAAAAAGVPSDAITVNVGPKITALAGLRGTWRPTGGGIQIQNSSSATCTLGFNVTTSSGLNGLLTAGHCAPGQPGLGATGGAVGQPILSSGIGTIQNNPVWNSTDPNCGGYSRCTLADALMVQYTVASTMAKKVAFTSFVGLNEQGGSITVTGWWDNVVTPSTSYFVGQAVDKEGPTTGWTRGTISATCVNVPVSDGYGTYMDVCADAVQGSRAGQGDSGSPVFVPPPAGQIHNPLYPLGILFAGGPLNTYDPTIPAYFCSSGCTYYFSHWSNIQTQLGTSFFPN